MGCDTKLIIKKRLSGKQLLKVIRTLFDLAAEYNFEEDSVRINYEKPWDSCELYNVADPIYYSESGFINFTYKGVQRSLFFINCNYSYGENNFYDGFDHTYCSLGYFGDSIEIMTKLAELFGGWIDNNDCDDEDFYRVNKKEDI